MEKKFKFSDNPTMSKIVYGVVVALLCVSAIVVGIIAANNRNTGELPDDPPSDTENETPKPDDGGTKEENENKKLSYMAPWVGLVYKGHSDTTPVYSTTLEEWRLHYGIDIMTEEGASVFACEDGEVTNVFNDPLLGKSIEITHSDGVKTVYKNLLEESVSVKTGDKVKRGSEIAKVGDSAIMEIADEAHLHFEMKSGDKLVNPLDYIDKESQKTSLGIE